MPGVDLSAFLTEADMPETATGEDGAGLDASSVDEMADDAVGAVDSA